MPNGNTSNNNALRSPYTSYWSAPTQRGNLINRIERAKSAYSVRRVDLSDASALVTSGRPSAGDLVLARVTRLGQHQHLEMASGRRCRLWKGDEIIVAYGERYAPDQFEAMVPEDLSECHLVAGGGIAARAVSRHGNMKPATEIEPIGLLANSDGVINVRSGALGPAPKLRPQMTFAVVGSSMNAGKTTTAANLIVGLRRLGHRVAAAKITGTGAGGDRWLLTDAGAAQVLDFTDAGYATTAGLPAEALDHILTLLVAHAASSGAHSLVLEIADGILQRETAMLVESHRFAKTVDAVLFAASTPMCAIAGVDWLQRRGLTVAAVSGVLTASPLAMREAAGELSVPVHTIDDLATAEVVSGLSPLMRRPPSQLAR